MNWLEFEYWAGGALVFGILGALVGDRREKAGWGFVAGFFLGPIGVLLAFGLRPPDEVASEKEIEPEPRTKWWHPVIGVTVAIVLAGTGYLADQYYNRSKPKSAASKTPSPKPATGLAGTNETALQRDAASGQEDMRHGAGDEDAGGTVQALDAKIWDSYGLTKVRVRFKNTSTRTFDRADIAFECWDAYGNSLNKQVLAYTKRLRPGRKSSRSGYWDVIDCDLATRMRASIIAVAMDGRRVRIRQSDRVTVTATR